MPGNAGPVVGGDRRGFGVMVVCPVVSLRSTTGYMLASLRDDKTIPKNTTPKNILKPEA